MSSFQPMPFDPPQTRDPSPARGDEASGDKGKGRLFGEEVSTTMHTPAGPSEQGQLDRGKEDDKESKKRRRQERREKWLLNAIEAMKKQGIWGPRSSRSRIGDTESEDSSDGEDSDDGESMDFTMHYPELNQPTRSEKHAGPERPRQPPIPTFNPPIPDSTTASEKAAVSQLPNERSGIYFPFRPRDPAAPHFTGTDITQFLEDYEFGAEGAGWGEHDKKRCLPYFCDSFRRSYIIKMYHYTLASCTWSAFKSALLKEYSSGDIGQQKTTRAFLESWLAQVHQAPLPLNEYYHQFLTYTNGALHRSQIMEIELGQLFFKGLKHDDQTMIMFSMEKKHRPVGGDVRSFKMKKMYAYLRSLREQEEAMAALSPGTSLVAEQLARREVEAQSLQQLPYPVEFLHPQQQHKPEALSGKPVAIVQPPPDLQVKQLVDSMKGLVLTQQQFNTWQQSTPATRSAFARENNRQYAFHKLVEPTLLVERNDGSFLSSYNQTQNPKADVQTIGNREVPKTPCIICGSMHHRIQGCPWRKKLLDNGWYHEKKSEETGYFDWHYGPYHLHGEKMRGRRPRAAFDDMWKYLVSQITEYYGVTDAELERPFADVKGLDGKKNYPSVSGNANTIEGVNDIPDEESLTLKREGLQKAAAFYRTLEERSTIGSGEVSIMEANGIETRSLNRPLTAPDKVSGSRVGKPKPKAKVKDTRPIDFPPAMEEQGELRQPVIGEFHSSVPSAELDEEAMLGQAAQLSERLSVSPAPNSQTLRETPEVPTMLRRKPVKTIITQVPTDEELIHLVQQPTLNSILSATLQQEVRGLTVATLLSQDQIVDATSKLLSAAKQAKGHRHDDPSGEVHTLRDQGAKDFGVLTAREIRALDPRLARKVREVLEARATQRYDVKGTRDGYDHELDHVTTEERKRLEEQLGVTTVKAEIPICWITVMGNLCEAILDSGAELNVMRLSTARALNVHIQNENQDHLPVRERAGMVSANGSVDEYVGTAYNVPVMVGTITVPTHFKVTRNVRRPLILGTPWCAAARLEMKFTPMGRCHCQITAPDGRKTVSFLGLDPSPTANYEGDDGLSGKA